MTLRLKLVHKKQEIQVAIPPHEAMKETFGDLKVRIVGSQSLDDSCTTVHPRQHLRQAPFAALVLTDNTCCAVCHLQVC